MRHNRVCLLLAVYLAAAFPLPASPPPTGVERPRVALVLSGGGAKGIAHIGVLKILEESRIPIDFIVGTSMGAIVGGLYASGMSPAEMERILFEIDWNDLFDDRPPPLELTHRQRRGRSRFTRVEVGLKEGSIALPRGLISGQKLGFMLTAHTLHTAGNESFDELPVPFRAVATDLETGQAVVLRGGRLAEAIRASMSVPGLFAPVELDGRLLVDGGLVNTLAIDVARDWGAEVIIASSVGGLDFPPEGVLSILDITLQTSEVVTRQQIREQLDLLGAEDVYIDVETGHSPMDFTAGEAIIVRGEEATAGKREELARYSVTPEAYDRYLDRQRRAPISYPVVEFIRVEPSGRIPAERIRVHIRSPIGRPIDLDTVRGDIDRIYGTGYFQTVQFRIAEEEGRTGLVYHVREKHWGPHYLRFGLTLNEDFRGGGDYEVSVEYLRSEMNRLGGEWWTEARVGSTLGLATSFYQPLDYSQRFFLDSGLGVEQCSLDVFEGGAWVGRQRALHLEASTILGFRPGSALKLLAGVHGLITSGTTLIGDGDLPEPESVVACLLAAARLDTLDNPSFPGRGLLTEIDLQVNRELGSTSRGFVQMEARVLGAESLGRLTALVSAAAGTTYGPEVPESFHFTLGGPFQVSGLRPGQLSGLHYGRVAFIPCLRVADIRLGWGRSVHVGGSLEAAVMLEDGEAVDGILLSGSLFVGLDTVLGPLYLGYGLIAGRSFGNLYLSLGRVF